MKNLKAIIPLKYKKLIKFYLSGEIFNLISRLHDTESKIDQISSIIRHESDLVMPPSKELQIRVIGGYFGSFIEGGYRRYDWMNEIINKAIDKQLSDFKDILDFGCGPGRILRAMLNRLPESVNLYGMDIDSEAIEYLKKNFPKRGIYYTNPHQPPTNFPSDKFDFIYVNSVFTHLPQNMEDKWLDELKRIIKPGGYIFITTHGHQYYQKFNQEVIEEISQNGFLYIDSNYGNKIGLPDFYQNSYHTVDYINKKWSKKFNIIKIIEGDIRERKDIVLLNKI